MPLPILIPAPHELHLLGRFVGFAPALRRFAWRPSTPPQEAPHCCRPPRQGRFAEPTSRAIRAALLARWRRRSAAWTRPPPAAPIQWRSRTGSDIRTLLRDAESLLKCMQRRRCSATNIRQRTLTALARGFDGGRWRLKVAADQTETLAALLCAMYWRGCRHPLVLGTARLHPPTTLVHWLSRFTVQQQVDHGRQILDALVAEEARVHDFALQVVRRMLPQRGAQSHWVALLPDLLSVAEPP